MFVKRSFEVKSLSYGYWDTLPTFHTYVCVLHPLIGLGSNEERSKPIEHIFISTPRTRSVSTPWKSDDPPKSWKSRKKVTFFHTFSSGRPHKSLKLESLDGEIFFPSISLEVGTCRGSWTER